MKLQIVIENLSYDKELLNEHGLSIYIEMNGKKMLFDLGAHKKFLYNAEKLGIDIKDIDYVVLSHGHYDHAGGLKEFLGHNEKACVYIKPDGMDNHYSIREDGSHYIGIDMDTVMANHQRMRFIKGDMSLMEGVYIISSTNKYEENQCPDLRLKKKIGGIEWDDDFKDEIILVINEKDGLTVFTGCSHNGIINMVRTVQDKFKGKPVKRVIGGFHLLGVKTPEDVKEFGRELFKTGAEKFYTCHCTGIDNYKIIKSLNAGDIEYVSSGQIIGK